MYIDLKVIYFIMSLLGCIAIVLLIISLGNLNKLLKNANELILENKDNVNLSIKKLPQVVSNFNDVSENIKDVSEVATDVTADIITTTENMKSNFDVVTDILNILKGVFGK